MNSHCLFSIPLFRPACCQTARRLVRVDAFQKRRHGYLELDETTSNTLDAVCIESTVGLHWEQCLDSCQVALRHCYQQILGKCSLFPLICEELVKKYEKDICHISNPSCSWTRRKKRRLLWRITLNFQKYSFLFLVWFRWVCVTFGMA